MNTKEKEPRSFQLTEKQLCELKKKMRTIHGLKMQSRDIAERLGELDHEIWEKVRNFLPETKGIAGSLNWETGEIIEVKDC